MVKTFALLFLATWCGTSVTSQPLVEEDPIEVFATANSQCKYPTGSGRQFTMNCATNKIRFATIGDWGIKNAEDVTLAIAQDINDKASQLDFVVAAGDNFYDKGVKSVSDKQWDNTWFNRYNVGQLNLLWLAFLGNHDHYGNAQAQIDYTTAGKRGSKFWFMPNNYFTLLLNANGKKFSFVTLDTDVLPGDSTQLQWLDTQLFQTIPTPRVVLGHHHVFSNGYRGDNAKLQLLASKFSSLGMKNYIGGHEHDMQLLAYNNTNYFVIGGGGAGLRGNENPDLPRVAEPKFYQMKHGYSRHEIDLDTNQMTTWIETFEENGDHAGTSVFVTPL